MKKTTKIWCSISIVAVVAIAVVLLVLQPWKPKQPEVIKIGAILPLTGPAAQFGVWKKEGIDMALEEINATSGETGRTIEVIYEDSKGDPKSGLVALSKLIEIEGCKIIFSDLSGVTLSILPMTGEDTLVITSATHPEVTSGKYLAIRNNVMPGQEAVTMAQFAKNKLGYSKVAVLYWNDQAMLLYNQVFSETFNSLGGETYSESYETGAMDFRTQLLKIKAWNPEAIYIAGWKEVGTIMNQAIELGIKAQFLGTNTFDSPTMLDVAGNAAEGAIYTVPTFGEPYQTNLSEEFGNKYEEIYGNKPEAMAAIWYDTMYVLADALKNSSTNPKDIYEYIVSKDKFSGVMGDFHFDHDGNIILVLGFKIVKNNKFEWLEK